MGFGLAACFAAIVTAAVEETKSGALACFRADAFAVGGNADADPSEFPSSPLRRCGFNERGDNLVDLVPLEDFPDAVFLGGWCCIWF